MTDEILRSSGECAKRRNELYAPPEMPTLWKMWHETKQNGRPLITTRTLL